MSTMKAALRCAQRALFLTACLGSLASFSALAQEAAPFKTVPNALLSIDQNRSTVVDRIVGEWGDALAWADTGLTAEQLRATLLAMRSDYLLAASVAGSLEGLRNVVASSLVGSVPAGSRQASAKALGNTAADLVYTPVVPCRLADTRNAGGFITGGSSRDFKVWVGGGGFTAQGGHASNCNIPANPAAVALNLTAVNPGGFGNLIVYPAGGAEPNTSVLNYQAGTFALANGAIVQACTPNCPNQITIKTNGAGADVVIDIVGYFAAPVATALECTQVASGSTSIAVSSDTLVTLPACAAGYTRVGASCSGPANVVNGYLIETSITGCLYRNLSAVATYNAIAASTCCRIPGR
jgi:hypothetical protein